MYSYCIHEIIKYAHKDYTKSDVKCIKGPLLHHFFPWSISVVVNLNATKNLTNVYFSTFLIIFLPS